MAGPERPVTDGVEARAFTRHERESFSRFTEAYLAASRYFEWHFRVVQVPFDGKEIVVHLHRPAGINKPPLVLYTGGIDGSKESGYGAARDLTPLGFAMAAFDLAGTGDSEEWLAEPESHTLHQRVLDFLESTGDFDFNRVGLIGGSFGGYYAVKMVIEPQGEGCSLELRPGPRGISRWAARASAERTTAAGPEAKARVGVRGSGPFVHASGRSRSGPSRHRRTERDTPALFASESRHRWQRRTLRCGSSGSRAIVVGDTGLCSARTS